MRRAVLGGILLVVGVVAVVAHTTIERDRAYERLITEGDTALATNRTLAAIEAFSGAITLRPVSMLAYLKRGEAYRRRREWTSALHDLSQAARLDPIATRPLERLGDVHYALERYGRAAERYADYVALDPQSPRVLYKLALARYRAGLRVAAMPPLRQAIAQDERFVEAYYLLGVCLHDQGDLPEARSTLETAVQIAPALVPAREALLLVYRALDRTRDEIDQLQALAALDPNEPNRLIALGHAYARAQRTDLAVMTLGRAAERFPDNPSVFVEAGRIWLDIAERRDDRIALSKALEALQAPAAGGSPTSETLMLLGRALRLSKDLELAERVLQQATTTLPVESGAFAALADTAVALGHDRIARDALVSYRAMVGAPATASSRAASAARIADLSLRIEEPAVAAVWLRRALEAAPANTSLWAQLVDAELKAGHVDQARTALAQALARAPESPSLLAFSRRLGAS